MYAQFWASCCLVTVTSFSALAQGTRVEVVLHNDNGTPDVILGEMRSELSALMGRAGFQIAWRAAQDANAAVAGDLVIVDLRGSCAPPSTSIRDSRIVQMGSSAVANGKVLPFSWVDCTAVAQLLEPYLTPQQAAQRDFVYGRAMARVLAHEFYHVLGRTLVHTASGLTKARLQPSDLLDEHAAYGKVAMSMPQRSGRPSLFVRAAAQP
jgi:hypothetical protein